MKLYPLQFNPIAKTKIWGGNKLNQVLNKGFEGENIGESWEISDVEGDETTVANGTLKGNNLRTLIAEYKGDLVGKKVYEKFQDKFPLLIKFIDAKTPLSIQVHPHDPIAKERHNSFGKNEMWYIMDANKNAEIIVGFTKKIDQNTYQKHVNDGTVTEVMNIEHTTAGDAFYIPTGRVHAIGAGVLLAEIQQTSDVTYRIFDYNRVDQTTGKTRDLHNELALDVIDFEVQDSYKTLYKREQNKANTLIHSPYFISNILVIKGELKTDYTTLDSFVILMCTKGSVHIKTEENQLVLDKGNTLLLPATQTKVTYAANSEAELLEVYFE